MTSRLQLRPYILSQASTLPALMARSPLPDTLGIDAFLLENQDFYRLVNAANRHAFGGLGMPSWVQLDCCALPSAQIGFCVPRDQVDPSLWAALTAHVETEFGATARSALSAYTGPVPMSQFCAVASLTPGVMVGFSLFSLVPRAGLGVRTKALALHCYGCTAQIGVAQYDNPAVRTHCQFGPLRLLQPVAWPHRLDTSTFVYELDLSQVDLAAMARHGARRAQLVTTPGRLWRVPVGPETYLQIQALQDQQGNLAIAPPGHEDGELLLQLA